MAQLKDTIIQGSARITDTLYTIKLQAKIYQALTASDGTTYGPGSSGQIIRSNGSLSYWYTPGAAIGYGVTDSSSASAIGTGTSLTTERDVYYGLPTINNAHNYTSSTTIYAPTAGGTADTQALVGNGATTAPKWVNISPSISITAGTSSDAPKVNVTVLGRSGTAQSITKATTGLWGVIKLSSTSSSSEEGLAATPKGVWAAINTLDVSAVGGGTGEYISKISEADGKISATKSTTTVSNTWTGGTTAGPTIKTTVNGVAGTAVAIPSASASASGVVTTGDQGFAGAKTFNNNITVTGVATFNGNVAMNSSVSADSLTAGSLVVNGNTSLVNTTNTASLLPHATTTYDIGSSTLKYSNVYATTFNGNATSATKATQDSDGNAINSTYIKKSVLSGAYDIMYSSAANTPTRLAANTTTTKKFLRMTGTGSAGAAPAWDTVVWGDIGSKPSSYTPSSHTHGNIQNGGTLQTNDVTIANGDKLVITDSSDSSKIARASLSFDGSTTTQALTKAGTWEPFNNYTLPLAADGTRGGIQIGFSTNATNRNYAVQLSSEKAYVNVPWTDTKVDQSESTTTNWRKVILSYQNNDTSYAAVTSGTTNNVVYTSRYVSIQPSSGILYTGGGIITPSVGVSGWIQYPGGGVYKTNTPDITGALKITLPQVNKSVMMSFDVHLYTYDGDNASSVVYHIHGYEYSANGWHDPVCRVYSEGIGAYTDLKVRFGADNNKAYITIGETTTTWRYPQVAISNVHLGYSDNWTYGNWGNGWSISFVTTLPSASTGSRENINTQNINITGNAATATNANTAIAIQTAGTTAQFYRGDNTWSNTLTGSLNVNGWLHVNKANSGTDNGITLYNGDYQYGIMFRQTSNSGKHGYVTGDWATYFTMSNNENRGWIFRRGSVDVASISGNGTFYGHLMHAIAYPNGKTDRPYHLIAEFNQNTASSQINTKIVFLISNYYSTEASGILEVSCHWKSNSTTPGFVRNEWLVCRGFNVGNVIVTHQYNEDKTVNLKVYLKLTGWYSFHATRIHEHNCGSPRQEWILHNANRQVGTDYTYASIPETETQVASTATGIYNNAATATKLASTPDNTSTFLRGDNTWSDTLSKSETTYSNHILKLKNTGDTGWIPTLAAVAPNMTTAHYVGINLGRATGSDNSCAHWSYYYDSATATNIRQALGFYNNTNLLTINTQGYVAHGDVVWPSNNWRKGTTLIGCNNYDKAIIGQNTINGLTIGAMNSALDSYAELNVAGSSINFRLGADLRAKILDGCLSLFPNTTSYRQGIRIHHGSDWSGVMLCGSDNTGDNGTSAKSWWIGNNDGTLYIIKNGGTSSSTGNLIGSTSNSYGYWEMYHRVGINGKNDSYNLYVSGSTYHTGIVYFGNGTTYYINGSAVGYLPDLRVDKTRLEDNWIGFYSGNNVTGNRLGYIQGSSDYMYFRKEQTNNGFNFNGNLVPEATGTRQVGTSNYRWKFYGSYLNISGDALITGAATFNSTVTMNSSATIDSLTAGSLTVSGNSSLVNTANTAALLPHATTTYDIGSSSLKYNTIYATSFNGTATNATADASGNTISSTYLKLSGGIMTGTITLASTGLKTPHANGYTTDQYGNFKHLSTVNTSYWSISKNNGTEVFKVYWETGEVKTYGLNPYTTISYTLGTSSLYWNGAFIHGNGNIHWNNLCWIDGQKVVTDSTSRGFPRIMADNSTAIQGHGNVFFGMPATAVKYEYTTNNGSTWTEGSKTNNEKRNFTNGTWSVNVFNVGNVANAASGATCTTAVGYGARVTLDLQVENRTGWCSCLIVRWTTRGMTCQLLVDRWNKNTNRWTTIENVTTSTDQYRVIYPATNFELYGNSSASTARRCNKIRITLLETAVGTANRYPPSIGGIGGYGDGYIGTTIDSTYKYSRLFDRVTGQQGTPLYISDRVTGVLRAPVSEFWISGTGAFKNANAENDQEGRVGLAYLTIGNGDNINAANQHSEGRIYIYSAATKCHVIRGASTTTEYHHYFPNSTGWIATGGNGTSTGAGDSSLPVFLSTGGVLTACTVANIKAGKDGSGNTITSTYLKLSGGTMTGALTVKGFKGTSNVDYGTTLPSSPTAGQIFFQISDPYHELPSGGTTGQALIKNSDSNYDVTWGDSGGRITLTTNNSTRIYPSGYAGSSAPSSEIAETLYSCSSVYIENNVIHGACWNDYAEYRETKEVIKPGHCIIENGDGTLSLSTERMQPGAEIVSDTYGFVIGQTKKCNTPIAVSGRVLAYMYEDYKDIKIGAPVCSGPNGTVSQMTEDEARNYPWLVIGTVSAIPQEKEWGERKVKVDGRVWIRVR